MSLAGVAQAFLPVPPSSGAGTDRNVCATADKHGSGGTGIPACASKQRSKHRQECLCHRNGESWQFQDSRPLCAPALSGSRSSPLSPSTGEGFSEPRGHAMADLPRASRPTSALTPPGCNAPSTCSSAGPTRTRCRGRAVRRPPGQDGRAGPRRPAAARQATGRRCARTLCSSSPPSPSR